MKHHDKMTPRLFDLVRYCRGRPSETKNVDKEYIRVKCDSTLTAAAISSKSEGNNKLKPLMSKHGWVAVTTLGERLTLCRKCAEYSRNKAEQAKFIWGPLRRGPRQTLTTETTTDDK